MELWKRSAAEGLFESRARVAAEVRACYPRPLLRVYILGGCVSFVPEGRPRIARCFNAVELVPINNGSPGGTADDRASIASTGAPHANRDHREEAAPPDLDGYDFQQSLTELTVYSR